MAILGAGPAGLVAAWRLALAGHRVVAFERGEQVGGMAASVVVDGIRVDLGSHRLHPSTSPRVLAALRGLLGDDLQQRPRNGRIALGGRFVSFPLQLPDLLRNLPPRLALAIARDAACAPLRRPRADSFAEAIRAGLGPAVLDSFYGPYARKLWDTDARDLSSELAARRVAAGSPIDVLARVLSRDGGGKSTFFYPRQGFGQIVEQLAHAAVDAGAGIVLGACVERIDAGEAGAKLSFGSGDACSARLVLSTVPITSLCRMLGDQPAEPATRTEADLRYRALRLVYLTLDRPRYTPFDAHYLPSVDTIGSRLSEPKNYRDGDDPADRTVLCVEVPCTVGDEIWNRSPERLGDQLSIELEALGLPQILPTSVTAIGLPNVYPVYRAGFERHLRTAEARLEGRPSVVALGRAGLFTPDNTHHALEMGWEAADCVRSDGSFDRDRWRRARRGFRANVVED